VLFRIFDIAKPWPIRRLEKLPQGWGILCDDLLAGIYAAITFIAGSQIGLVGYLSDLPALGAGSLNVFNASILGVVQGLTEFLPVSSSGHLVLIESFFNFNPKSPEMLLFDLAIHVGTLAAVIVVFRKSIVRFVQNLRASGKYVPAGIEADSEDGGFSIVERTPTWARPYIRAGLTLYRRSPSVRLLVLAFFATFITGVCGLTFSEFFVRARGNLPTVALMWVITGTLLLAADRRKKTRLGLRGFGLWHAAVVGLAQAAAIMPGISRSGATICAAILIGLHRRWAVEFSFLIAIPAILGATAIKLAQDFGQISSGVLPLGSLLAGAGTAAVVGVMALSVVIRASRRAKLKYFGVYCFILAFLVVGYVISRS
jgi:undecaprenyl-diphosphatase